MHWLTKPGTSLPEETRISARALSGAPIDSRSPQLRVAHRAGSVSRTRSSASTSAKTGSASTPEADYDKTLASVQEVVDGYPGLFRDVQTYLQGANQRGPDGHRAKPIVVRIFGDDLERPPPRGRRGAGSSLRTIDGLVDLHVELQAEVPQIEVETDLVAARRHGVKPGDVRRAAAALIAERSRSATSSRPARIFDVQRLEHSRDAPQSDKHSRASDRHARRRPRALGRCRRGAHRADPECHQA